MSERIAFDYSKLRGRMVEKFGAVYKAAEAAGIRKERMSLILQGKSPMTPSDIYRLTEVLEIPEEEAYSYFFVDRVAKVST